MMGPAALPQIRIEGARISAGPYTLEPSHKDWKRRRCFWRVLLAGKPVTPFRLTPRLALAEALRRTS